MWVVAYLPEAEQERAALPKAKPAALITADAKLSAYGPQLGYPHTSAVRNADRLRELRPRPDAAPGGRCTGRAVRCSWWQRSGRRPSRTRAVSSGRCGGGRRGGGRRGGAGEQNGGGGKKPTERGPAARGTREPPRA